MWSDQLLWYPWHNGLHPQARSPLKPLLPYTDFSPGILSHREKGNLGMLLGVIWVCCLVLQTDSLQRGVTQTSECFHNAQQRHLAEETFRKVNPTGGLTQKVKSFSALFVGVLGGQDIPMVSRKSRQYRGINCLFLSACSSGEDQLRKALFSSDYEFFKTVLSMVIDISLNGSQNRRKEKTSSKAYSFQDFSLKSYFCKGCFFLKKKKRPKWLFPKIEF